MVSNIDAALLKDYTEECFCLVGLDFNLVTFNRRFAEMYFEFFGKKIEAGQCILDYAQKHRREVVKDIYRQVFGGVELESEVEASDKSGKVHTFTIRYKPYREGDRISGAFVSTIDITEIRSSTQKLQASERRIRTLVEYSGDVVTVLRTDGHPKFVSPSVARILGYTLNDFLQLNFFEQFHSADQNTLDFILNKVLDLAGHTETQLLRIRHFDGRWLWVETTFTNDIYDSEIAGLVVNFRDVTSQVNLQEQLRRSEEQFRGAFEHSAVGMALISPDGTWKEVNQSVLNLFGYTAKELRQLTFQDITHPDDLESDLDLLNELVEGKIESYQMEKRYFHKSGRLVWGLLSVSKVTDEAGRLLHFVSQIQDISERVKVSEELKRRVEELAMTNAELEQFAYIASHDLQEPLRMVTGFLSQLEKKYKPQLDEKAQQYIHFAMDGALRMRKILLDLLEYSRVGRGALDLEDIDMNQLVAEVVRLHQIALDETDAEVKFKDLGLIRAARTPMLQLFQNLIGNALKYHHPERKPLVEIDRSETVNYWQFSVKDNGIGIDPMFYDKIFVIFQRLHGREEYSGTGIGLAICKKIVDNHNGQIWVRSNPGEGSTFFFTISKNLP